MEKRRIVLKGINSGGVPWSLGAELPKPCHKLSEELYNSLEERLMRRAERDGLFITGRTVVTYEGQDVYSLYTELVFTSADGNTPATVTRLCDTRAGGILLPIPKGLRVRGCYGFCIMENKGVAFVPNGLAAGNFIRQRDTEKYFNRIYADIDLDTMLSRLI